VKNKKLFRAAIILMAVIAVGVLVARHEVAAAGPKGVNGTTLTAYKTLDICEVAPASGDTPAIWRYFGEIAVWNTGAIDTVGLAIDDWIQTKVAGGQYYNILQVPQGQISIKSNPYNVTLASPLGEIQAGTTQTTATVFSYWVEGPALDPLYIKNVANITILNHSNYIGTPYGPSPKVSWTGGYPPPCPQPPAGCTYTQGYWGSKPGVVWPYPYNRDDIFYSAIQINSTTNKGQVTCTPVTDPYGVPISLTWQQVMDADVSQSQGYYQLAHQYIAAVLNIANGASVPEGIQTALDDAQAWLVANNPTACCANGSCGIQKGIAAILDQFNNGLYPGGPVHCAE
jgi:hypothetical protein